MLRTLDPGAYELRGLYDYVEQRMDVSANGGLEPSGPEHPTDPKWRHGVRSWLANQQRSGLAWPLRRAVWAIERGVAHRRYLLLISPDGRLDEVELQVADAVELLRSLDGPIDAVITDPPWGLSWDKEWRREHFARDHSKVIGGYIDVPAGTYLEFSQRWISVAAETLRPGGQLVVVTGPQTAAHVQIAAERAGLTWVAQIIAEREFVAKSERRPSPAHWVITAMTRGRLHARSRVFHAPDDQRRSKTGGAYPLSIWVDNGRSDRHGLLRYATMLPPRLSQRMVRTFTDPGEHVCDPMAGGGEVVHACQLLGRRVTAGDRNPNAIAFIAARLLAEQIWPAQQAPALFARAA